MSAPPGDPAVSEIVLRVNYSEVDPMRVAYHARYVVWLDLARTEHLRRTGVSYRELEEGGLLLAVAEVNIRYRRPARYDDLVRVRCWVRDLASRRIVFGYAIEHAEDGRLLATASTTLIPLDRSMTPRRLPEDLARRLVAIADPVRI